MNSGEAGREGPLRGVAPTAREDWKATLEWLGVADIDFSRELSEADEARWKNAHEKFAR